MAESRGSAFFANLLRLLSFLVQLGILIALALLLAEVKQFRKDGASPLRVAVQQLGSSILKVSVTNSAATPVPVQLGAFATPTVVVANSRSNPLFVDTT